MSDRILALRLVDAADGSVEEITALADVCERIGIPDDEIEQGLTAEQAQQVSDFVALALIGPKTWSKGGRPS